MGIICPFDIRIYQGHGELANASLSLEVVLKGEGLIFLCCFGTVK
jgi:hypothetical protein